MRAKSKQKILKTVDKLGEYNETLKKVQQLNQVFV